MRWFRRRPTRTQLHANMVLLEQRIDAIADALVDLSDRATTDDVSAATARADRVASELGRLEVNLAARLDAVRSELRELRGEPAQVIDLRVLTPTDTGWSLPAG